MIDYLTLLGQCYNPEAKAKFLSDMFSDNQKKATAYITTFKMFCKYEKLYEKDLSDWTYSMLISVFENMRLSPSSFDERLRQVKSYYLYNNRQAPIIKYHDLDSSWMKSRYFDSFESLDKFFSEILCESEKDSLDIMRKACIYLLFLGVDKDRIPYIKKQSVSDTENHIDGIAEDLNIPKECMEILRRCKNMKSYFVQNTQYRFNYSERYLTDSEYLIRGDADRAERDYISGVFIRRIFENDQLRNSHINPTIVTVHESGLFCYVYEKENDKIFTANEFKELVEKFNPKIVGKKGYLHDKYISWKKAFKSQSSLL